MIRIQRQGRQTFAILPIDEVAIIMSKEDDIDLELLATTADGESLNEYATDVELECWLSRLRLMSLFLTRSMRTAEADIMLLKSTADKASIGQLLSNEAPLYVAILRSISLPELYLRQGIHRQVALRQGSRVRIQCLSAVPPACRIQAIGSFFPFPTRGLAGTKRILRLNPGKFFSTTTKRDLSLDTVTRIMETIWVAQTYATDGVLLYSISRAMRIQAFHLILLEVEQMLNDSNLRFVAYRDRMRDVLNITTHTLSS
ncbi:uncharacterized protein MYCFIDRAFT_178644 [Pseudocercospora fijiensis CIRAD86]|uniref:Uncharacterized protein n=1 Tax=Pseudocercospora fijiensis (strain CIRAD86) TaxID=383855 RepID=M3A279_PSEFD|nr:uncharacterized protein MYCFIDRAFT_178644 [Pseudocercospora fijiensis CIRAD86]EME78506.1 hypothetical protein MYCFIDRAFT_178644 [Pseudocercospora fijiensis CIRAD86]